MPELRKPECFGKYPKNPGTAAERDCGRCKLANDCDYITRQAELSFPEQIGTKNDGKKPRWSLLPKGTVEQVIAVLEFGAAKYQVDNWQHVDDPERRYYDAAMRHLEAWWRGEKDDPESKLPHLAHAVCCLLFLMWFHRKAEKAVWEPMEEAEKQARLQKGMRNAGLGSSLGFGIQGWRL